MAIRLIRSAAAIAILVAGTGCGDDDDGGRKPAGDSGTTTGWTAAVGEDGTFAQTFDDQSWRVRRIADVDLLAVTCVGNTDGWAVGEGGSIAHSADAGETWQPQSSGTTETLRTVHFAHDHSRAEARFVGITAGDAGTLAVTTDGGKLWKLAATGTLSALRGATGIVSANLLVAVGDAGTVLRSVDTGQSWQRLVLPNAPSLSAVDADPNGKLIAVVDASGGIWTSTDGAQSFTLEHQSEKPLRAIAVAPDASRALAAGDAGTTLERSPSGSWQTIVVRTSADLRAALISHDGRRAYVAGAHGTVSRSAAPDFASGWSPVALPTTLTLSGLEDLDPD